MVKKKLKNSLIIILLFALIFSNIPIASASIITINIEGSNVSESIFVSIYQNFTSLPEMEFEVDGYSYPHLKNALSDAIKAKLDEAAIDNLNFSFKQNMNWINITGSFEVSNIMEKEEENLKINCVWKSFKIIDELQIENSSFNCVGISKLMPFLEAHKDSESARFFSPFYTPVSYENAIYALENICLLDFELLEIPVQEWEKSFLVGSQRTRWYLGPLQSGYLRIEKSIINQTINHVVESYMNAQILVSGHANAENDIIIFDIGEGRSEIIMIAIISSLAIIGIVGYLIERRFR